MSENYVNENNEVKQTEENYVRVVPSVMGLLTLPDGRRVQRLSESHYLKKKTSRFSPIGGAEAVTLEGITELSEAVEGKILYEIPRRLQKEGMPNLSNTPNPNEHGLDYDLRVYIEESQLDNFYHWMNNTQLREGVAGIIRECHEELALEARIDGYGPVFPNLTLYFSASLVFAWCSVFRGNISLVCSNLRHFFANLRHSSALLSSNLSRSNVTRAPS